MAHYYCNMKVENMTKALTKLTGNLQGRGIVSVRQEKLNSLNTRDCLTEAWHQARIGPTFTGCTIIQQCFRMAWLGATDPSTGTGGPVSDTCCLLLTGVALGAKEGATGGRLPDDIKEVHKGVTDKGTVEDEKELAGGDVPRSSQGFALCSC